MALYEEGVGDGRKVCLECGAWLRYSGGTPYCPSGHLLEGTTRLNDVITHDAANNVLLCRLNGRTTKLSLLAVERLVAAADEPDVVWTFERNQADYLCWSHHGRLTEWERRIEVAHRERDEQATLKMKLKLELAASTDRVAQLEEQLARLRGEKSEQTQAVSPRRPRCALHEIGLATDDGVDPVLDAAD